jgi:hypothetical protein
MSWEKIYNYSHVFIYKVFIMPTPLLEQAQRDIGTTRNVKMVVPLVPHPATHIRIDDTVAIPSTDKYLTIKVR